MSRRDELEAVLRHELRRRLAGYQGMSMTLAMREKACQTIRDVLKGYDSDALLGPPKLVFLQHRSVASRFMVVDEDRWKEMKDVGDDVAWIVAQ